MQFIGLQINDTPSHNPGYMVYFYPKNRVLITGDLFTEKMVFLGVQ
ncbi:MBL fold metallo-hydrolase [Lactobacillus panisapium]